MGMFDYVHEQLWCPYCGAEIYEFQTKDTTAQFLVSYTLADFKRALLSKSPASNPLWATGNIYTTCGSCAEWVEIVVQAYPPAEAP